MASANIGSAPGVYPSITDLSQIITANSTVYCGYVGESEFGPVNEPTLITSLKNYTERFGALSPSYGYMGYSLAVAADTINKHYVVRVVDEDTARYGATKIALNGQTITALTAGYTVDEIDAAKEDSGALFISGETEDTSSAFIITANDPNNRTFKATIEDSTVNVNKNYTATSTYGTSEGVVYVTVPEVDKFEADDTVIISDASDSGYDGTYTASSIANTYYFAGTITTIGADYAVGDTFTFDDVTLFAGGTLVGTVTSVDGDGGVTGFSFNSASDMTSVTGSKTTTATSGSGAGLVISVTSTSLANVVVFTITDHTYTTTYPTGVRILKYPADDETSFTIKVYETVGKTTTLLEKWQYCTLYANKDKYGASTFVEDVINDNSVYIRVFANPYATTVVPAYSALNELEYATSGDSPSSDALVAKWALFNNRSEVNVTLLMNSGYANSSESSYQNAMLETAITRRDCFCLLDVP